MVDSNIGIERAVKQAIKTTELQQKVTVSTLEPVARKALSFLSSAYNFVCASAQALPVTIQLSTPSNKKNGRPLFQAVQAGNLEAVERLLAQGMDPNVKDGDQCTPLYFAARDGHSKIAELLLNSGADAAAKNKFDSTALLGAVNRDDLAMVDLLLRKGADVNVQQIDGLAPLHLALENKNLEVIDRLLASGADVNAKNEFGNTALLFAVHLGDAAMVDLLLRKGADVNVQQNKGSSALHLAVLKKDLKVIDRLLASGADVNVMDHDGDTPLSLMPKTLFDSTVYWTMQDADNGVTREVSDLQLLAHYYGLSGSSVIGDQIFGLEGFIPHAAAWTFQEALSSYYKPLIKKLAAGQNTEWSNLTQKLSPESLASVGSLQSKDIVNILTNTLSAIATDLTVDEILDRHTKSLPVGIPVSMSMNSGSNHITGLALVGNRLARCDKGGVSKSLGIVIQTIGKPEALKQSLLQLLPKSTSNYFTQDIVKDLELSNPVHLLQKQQKVGNCGIANTNSLEMALLYLQLEPLIGAKAAEELARVLKKARKEFSKLELLKKYLQRHQGSPVSSDHGLFGQVRIRATEILVQIVKKVRKGFHRLQVLTRHLKSHHYSRIDAKAADVLTRVLKRIGKRFSRLDLIASLQANERRRRFSPDLGLLGQIHEKQAPDSLVRNLIQKWATKKNISITAMETLGSVQAHLGSHLELHDPLPNLHVLAKAYKKRTEVPEVDQQMKRMIELLAKRRGIADESYTAVCSSPLKEVSRKAEIKISRPYSRTSLFLRGIGCYAAVFGLPCLLNSDFPYKAPIVLVSSLGMQLIGLKALLAGVSGTTPLHLATNKKIAALLVKCGFGVNVRDASQWTPLHNAVIRGDVQLADILIEGGADMNARDEENMTPLKIAIINKEIEIADRLISLGADTQLNLPNELQRGRKLIQFLEYIQP